MSQISWNLIEMNVLILMLYIGYVGIRRRLSFAQRRTVLIGLPVVAVTTILIKSGIDISGFSYSLQVVELSPIQVGAGAQMTTLGQTPLLSLNQLYWIGALCFGLLFVFRIAKIISFFHKNDSKKVEEYRIYKVKGKTSFSFFNYIQITPSLTSTEQDIVLEHEKMHVKKRHSVDTIFIEIAHVIFWFNPIFFFIKREMVNLHEYEVDALMYQKHKVNYMKFLVNYALGLNGTHYLLTSRFYNQLTLKKRIKIMKTNIRKKSWLLSVIPLIGMLAIAVQCTKEGDTSDERTDNRIEEIVEAPEKVYEDVEIYPEYDGGQTAMTNFIIENVEYPKAASEEGVEGTAYVQFVVSSTGAIKDAVVMNDLDERLAEEALRVVEIMPNWIPGENKGKKVAVKFTLPISFKLS